MLLKTIFVSLLFSTLCFAPAHSEEKRSSTAKGVLEQNSARPGPELQVDFLGAEGGFAVGMQRVTLLCVIRNTGTAPLGENAARVRCYPLTGLDFTEGQLWPILPALAPGQSVAYRWRLAPTDPTTPLVSSVLLSAVEKPSNQADTGSGGPRGDVKNAAAESRIGPSAFAVRIPHFPAAPHLLAGAAGWGKTVQSASSAGQGWVGNDRILLHVMSAQGRVPVMNIAAKDGTEWKSIALSAPLIQVKSAEEGQTGWWETFRWKSSQTQVSKDFATLTLEGSCGPNWGAEISLEAKPDTGQIHGRLRLTARRNLRCYRVQFPRLMGAAETGITIPKADGSAQLLEADSSPLAENDRLAAGHNGALTYGIAWPSAAPLQNWHSSRLPTGYPGYAPIFGGEWAAEERGEVVLTGAILDFPFSLFAFGPSFTVRDALRFAQP